MLSSAFLALSFLLLGAEASPLSRRQWNQSIPISANDSSSLPLQLNTKNWDIKKAIDGDFPDPSIWKEGQTWYAFATTSGGINTQVATSSNFKSWNVLQSHDALPTPGAWVDTSAPNIWAPDVFKNNKGQFVLYYSGSLASSPAHHCVGIATSNTITGPYNPQSTPVVCPQSIGGAIDAAHFRDDDGTRYMVYKVDGNSIGSGGSCNNGNAPIIATPIMLQKMKGDGITPVGQPIQILTNNAQDGPLVEAPSISKASNGKYMLLFSSGCYTDPSYDTKYALANKVSGPYTRGASPLWGSGSDGLVAPGGADATHNAGHVAFHATNTDGTRSMWTAQLTVNGKSVKAYS